VALLSRHPAFSLQLSAEMGAPLGCCLAHIPGQLTESLWNAQLRMADAQYVNVRFMLQFHMEFKLVLFLFAPFSPLSVCTIGLCVSFLSASPQQS
jgi:hypothetical protein